MLAGDCGLRPNWILHRSDALVPDYSQAFQMQDVKAAVGHSEKPVLRQPRSGNRESCGCGHWNTRKTDGNPARRIELPSTTIPMDRIYANVRAVEAYTYHAKWLAESPEKYQPTLAKGFSRISQRLKRRRMLSLFIRYNSFAGRFGKRSRRWTLLITPTLSLLPVKILNGIEPVGGSRYPLGIRNTAPFNLLGVPAITVPCGFTTSGLPIGLQIVGAPFAEPTVLALAGAYESNTEWHLRRPALR